MNARALTEQVEMTVRWKRSSGTPWAKVTAALIGSAWLTTTMVLLRCLAASRSSVVQIRSCISAKDSPSGNRNVLGVCWTARHSGFFAKTANFFPVHVPKSHSSSPRSTVGSRRRALAMGAAVSRARSRGEM